MKGAWHTEGTRVNSNNTRDDTCKSPRREPDVCVCVCVCVCVRARSCLTLPDPMNCSAPGSTVHGVVQARILEWVAISSSRGSSKPRDQTRISFISCVGRWILYHCATWEALVIVTKSCLTLATPWNVARQAPLSMGFSRQEY